MLRIVSKCSSVEEFVSVFRRFCDKDSIFVVTKKPKPVGTTPRFLITLSNSKPMLVGTGKVVEAYEDKKNPFGRPGMRIRFTKLDENSKQVLRKLVEANKPAALPPTPLRPPGPGMKIPDIPLGPKPKGGPATPRAATPRAAKAPAAKAPAAKPPTARPPTATSPLPKPPLPKGKPKLAKPEIESAAPDPIEDEPTNVKTPSPFHPPSEAERAAAAEAEALAQSLGNAESSANGDDRAAGSDFILPANPFGDLTEASLEAFVECTMYEETGSHEIDELLGIATPVAAEGSAPNEAPGSVPAWWPKEGEHTPPPPEAPQAASAAPQQVVGEVPSAPQQYNQVPAAVNAYATAPPQTGALDPTELVQYPRKRRPGWVIPVVAAVAASLLTLAIGYAIWGGSDDDKNPVEKGSKATKPSGKDSPAPGPSNTADDGKAASAGGPKDEPKDETHKDKATKDEAAKDEAAKDEAAKDDEAAKVAANDAKGEPDKKERDDGSKAAAPGSGGCKLRVISEPDGATAYAGRKRLGETPVTAAVPCSKQVAVRLSHPRYENTRRNAKVSPGETATVKVQLQRPTHTVRVTSYPSRASVSINGHSAGRTPLTTKVPGYERTGVRISLRGYRTYTTRIYTNKQVTTVRARLKRR